MIAAAVFACSLTTILANSGKISAHRQCQFHLNDQHFQVENPAILTLSQSFGDACSAARADHCQTCAAFHRPCKGQFAACPGCCDTPWADKLVVPQEHTCDHIKSFFLLKNSHTLVCQEVDQVDASLEVTLTDHSPMNVSFNDLSSPGDGLEQNFSMHRNGVNFTNVSLNRTVTDLSPHGCGANLTKWGVRAIPMKFRFDCSSCRLSGVPDLLYQCCDAGKRLMLNTSTRFNDLRAQGFEPFVWLDGCHSPTFELESGAKLPFSGVEAYSDFTEEAVNNSMESHIEATYCVKAQTVACPSPRRLGMADGDTNIIVDTTCAWIQFHGNGSQDDSRAGPNAIETISEDPSNDSKTPNHLIVVGIVGVCLVVLVGIVLHCFPEMQDVPISAWRRLLLLVSYGEQDVNRAKAMECGQGQCAAADIKVFPENDLKTTAPEKKPRTKVAPPEKDRTWQTLS